MFFPWINKPILGTQLDLKHPLSKGLVAFWLMNEGSGSLVVSSTLFPSPIIGIESPYRRSGRFVGGIKWGGGRFGSALDLDGTDGHLNMGEVGWTNFGSGDYAFSIWMHLKGIANGRQMLIAKDSSISTNRQYTLEFDPDNDNGNKIRFLYFKSGPSAVLLDTASNAVNDVGWHHILGQRNGNSFDIYIDGKLNVSGTTSGTHGTMQNVGATLNIGKRAFVGAEDPFNGSLDIASIYDRALSSKEALSLYNEPFQMFQPMYDPAIFMDIAAAGGLQPPLRQPFAPSIPHLTR